MILLLATVSRGVATGESGDQGSELLDLASVHPECDPEAVGDDESPGSDATTDEGTGARDGDGGA